MQGDGSKMTAFEFEEEREYETLEQVVEEIAYFVGHPEFLMRPQVGYCA
jgi:hypothetical protein